MDRVLLLHEGYGYDESIKDYLLLGGFQVVEAELFDEIGQLVYLNTSQIIVIMCNEVSIYVSECARLRKITDKPIMVLSKEDGEWQKVKMFQCGADDYVVLPCLQSELVARIKAHINRYQRLCRSFGFVEVRGLCVDTVDRRVTLNGESIHLRIKEFEILSYLIKNQDRVVTKEEIYHEIWRDGDIRAGYNNTVAVHVKRLREKIEADIENPQYIQTIWGAGYRFVGGVGIDM